MGNQDQRKYPRIDLCAQQRILHLSSNKELVKNLVLSRNVSANGFCFRSPKAYAKGDILLVYLDKNVLEDLKVNRARVMKAGNYFMGRVVWSKPYKVEEETFFEIGCSFLELAEGNQDKVELFTHLINQDTAEKILPS